MRETCKIHFNWVWACVVVYKYVIQFVVMELVLGQSFMVISSIGVLLYAKVAPLYNVLLEWLCCCLQVNYIVYKHFDRSLHVLIVAWALVPHWSYWHSCDVGLRALRHNCAHNANVITRESPGNN